ncbi:MAG: hypothetical protein IT463_13405 [Planctomycetes bacterium]|nr:hypothetical protein [Planctomycetota bacterium]
MNIKRVAVLVLVGLVIGGGVFAAILFFTPVPEKTPPYQDPTTIVQDLPALRPVPSQLLEAKAPARPQPVAFFDAANPAVSELRRLANGAAVSDLEFTPDGRWLVTLDYGDMRVRVWDWRAGTLHAESGHPWRLDTLAMAPDGSGFWTGDAYEHLFWWPLNAEGRLGTPLEVGKELGHVMHVAASPNGRLIATSSYSQVLTVWDAATRSELARVQTPEPQRACAFSPDSRRLVVGTNTRLLYEYDLATGKGRKIEIPLVQPDTELMDLTFSDDGKRFSTGHTQPWATVWHTQGMEYRHFMECPLQAVTAVAWTRDSAWLVFALGQNDLYIWDPDNRSEQGRKLVLRGHQKSVRSLAFSPDGAVLASGDEGGNLLLWSKPAK